MLVELPTELILLVITQPYTLKPTDLYRLSQTCRTLKVITLPIFLSRCGIHSTTHISLHIPRWNPSSLRAPDALMGLNAADYITHLEVLKCFFQDPHLTTGRNVSQKVEDLPLAVERLLQFIQRVRVVKHAVISLIWDPYYISPNASFIPVDKLNTWSTHLSALLNTLVERRCETLTIQYRSMFEPAFHFRQGGWVKKKFTSITRQGGAFLHVIKDKDYPRLAWEYDLPPHLHIDDDDPTRLISHPNLSSLAQEVNWMTVLRIHSDVLLRPPMLLWTLGLLRNSQHIAELSFAHVLCRNEEWKIILTAIKEVIGKRLCILTLGVECPGLEGETAVEFISHLENLTHLTLAKPFSRVFVGLSQDMKNRRNFNLLKLKDLTAPLDFAQLVLGQPRLGRDHRSSVGLIPTSPTRYSSASTKPHHPSLPPLTKPPCPSLTKLTLYPIGFGYASSDSSDPLRSHFLSCKEVAEFIRFVNNQRRAYDVYVVLDIRSELGELKGMVDIGETYRRNISNPLQSGVHSFGSFSPQTAPLLSSLSTSPLSPSNSPHSTEILSTALGAYTYVTELVLSCSTSRLRDLTPRMLCRWIRLYVPHVRVVRLKGSDLEDDEDPSYLSSQSMDDVDRLRSALLGELKKLNGNNDQAEGWPRMRIQALVLGGKRTALDM